MLDRLLAGRQPEPAPLEVAGAEDPSRMSGRISGSAASTGARGLYPGQIFETERTQHAEEGTVARTDVERPVHQLGDLARCEREAVEAPAIKTLTVEDLTAFRGSPAHGHGRAAVSSLGSSPATFTGDGKLPWTKGRLRFT